MIPQEVTAWNTEKDLNSGAYLSITFSDGKVAYIPFGITLEAGIKYKLNINVGKKSTYTNEGGKFFNQIVP